MSEQLSAVVGLLDKLSLDQVREADRELLLKFMRLCHHWHMLTQDEVDRRDAARKWAKRELKSLRSRK